MNEKKDYVGYYLAWVKYAGAFLTRLSNVGNVIKESFADIQVPRKDEFGL